VVSFSVNHNTLFGSACHGGLAHINKLLQQGAEPCLLCPRECKLHSAKKKDGALAPVAECRVQQLMNQCFLSHMTPENLETIKKQFSDKGKAAEGKDVIDKLLRIGPNAMRETMFLKQPMGDIKLVEDKLDGSICGFKMGGVVDLYLHIGGKGLIIDYKSRADDPSNESFPMRQFSVYAKLLRDKGEVVNGLGTIYLIKKEPPKRKTSKSKAVHEYAIAHYINLDECKDQFDNVLRELGEDMDGIRERITAGHFTRNRNSMFCSTCDVKAFCEKPALVDKFMSEKQAVAVATSETLPKETLPNE
jgi:hypothetical protein